MQDELIKVLNFSTNIPKPYESTERSDNKYVTYGTDNLYPNYLLSLYNSSPIHSSIINGKSSYLIGDGLRYSDGSEINIKVNASDNLNELVDKIVKDYLIFNYFAIEVIYNLFNEPIEYHFIPAHKIRTNKTKTKFWFNDDWKNSNRHITYDRYRQHSVDNKSKIFFFDGYYPSLTSTYSSPEYNGSIKSIATDIAIRDFNLNQIKNHFSVSTLITFFNGSNIDDNVKSDVLRELKQTYSGENGLKMIVDWQNQNGKSAEVKNISANDWHDAYQELSKNVADDIYRGHAVTSPMLFGCKTEGQLGGSTELETSYEIFKNTYIAGKRIEIENAINQLFAGSTLIKAPVVFQDKALFSARISEATKEKIYTINELRKEAGLQPLQDGDRLLSAAAPAPATKFESDKGELISLSEADYEKIKEMGVLKDEYEFINDGEDVFSIADMKAVELKFDTDTDIANYVIKNDIKFLTIAELKTLIRKDTGITITSDDLRETLKRLHDAGIIDVRYTKDKVNIHPTTKGDVPNSRSVETMYAYEVRSGLGAPIIPTTRSFCKKLVENNRVYTRSEIQQMAALFGYDIFKFCGGFYFNPNTQTTTPYCRHQWKGYSVIRKVGK